MSHTIGTPISEGKSCLNHKDNTTDIDTGADTVHHPMEGMELVLRDYWPGCADGTLSENAHSTRDSQAEPPLDLHAPVRSLG